jgi:serine/threonine protein kinase
MVLELLVVEFYTAKMGRAPRTPLLGPILADNQFTRLIDRRILARMNAVRDLGNLGAHGAHVEASDAKRALDNLCEILDWYQSQRQQEVPPQVSPPPRLEAPVVAPVPTAVAPTVDATRIRLINREKAQIAGYEILSFLGTGSYGAVWEARDQRTGDRVAIKLFLSNPILESQVLAKEVSSLARFGGTRGVVPIRDVNLDADPPYLVMDFAENGSLDKRLVLGPMRVPEALSLFHEISRILAYVHAKGICHCDIKPGNILLNAQSRPLIGDFGQGHLTAPALGTVFYMAPEQVDLTAQVPDPRWDVYALGAVFYAMVTGCPPIVYGGALRETMLESADKSAGVNRYRTWVLQAPMPQGHYKVPGMDRMLAGIVDRCLERDPTRRFSNAGAVCEALDRYMDERWRSRPWWTLIVGIAGASILLLALKWVFF